MNKAFLESQIKEKERTMKGLLPYGCRENKELWHQLRDEVDILWRQLKHIEKSEVKKRILREKDAEYICEI